MVLDPSSAGQQAADVRAEIELAIREHYESMQREQQLAIDNQIVSKIDDIYRELDQCLDDIVSTRSSFQAAGNRNMLIHNATTLLSICMGVVASATSYSVHEKPARRDLALMTTIVVALMTCIKVMQERFAFSTRAHVAFSIAVRYKELENKIRGIKDMERQDIDVVRQTLSHIRSALLAIEVFVYDKTVDVSTANSTGAHTPVLQTPTLHRITQRSRVDAHPRNHTDPFNPHTARLTTSKLKRLERELDRATSSSSPDSMRAKADTGIELLSCQIANMTMRRAVSGGGGVGEQSPTTSSADVMSDNSS